MIGIFYKGEIKDTTTHRGKTDHVRIQGENGYLTAKKGGMEQAVTSQLSEGFCLHSDP